MKRKKLALMVVFLFTFSLTGCNFFKWLHSPKGTAEEHIAQGQKHLEDRNYSAAVSEFDDAIECDNFNSTARYGYAKAYARLYLKKDLFDLAAEFSRPVVDDILFDFPIDEIESIYDVSCKVKDVLDEVYEGKCHGEIRRESIYLDYGMSCTLQALSYAMIKFQDLKWKFDSFTNGFTLDNLDSLPPGEAAAIINDVIDTVAALLPLAQEAIQLALKDES